jgi:cytochrome o ubiquinol oxidase operon protein cyoD
MNGSRKSSLRAYIIGFALSIILTLLAYFTVATGSFPPQMTIIIIVSFAIIQLFVQLVFFLHLGSESRPRWRLVSLGFGVLVVAIVVFGSLWIMDNLNYNMMHSPQKMDEYIDRQSGF